MNYVNQLLIIAGDVCFLWFGYRRGKVDGRVEATVEQLRKDIANLRKGETP